MDYAISLAKRFVASPFNTPKRRKQKEMDHSSELSLLGLDSMLRVLSFVDGESMYEVGCVNKDFDVAVSHPSNWISCTIDFQSMTAQHIFATIRRYGHLIKCLRIRGHFSVCLKERLFPVINMYCTNLEFIDSFGSPYLLPISNKTTAFSLTFPSCASNYLTVRDNYDRYLMYSKNDIIIQYMDTYGHDFSTFRQSIWQFEIDNHLRKGFTATFECMINNLVVGSFTIADASIGAIYAINMMYPILKGSLDVGHSYLTLAIRCATQLPFGAGYVRVSSIGRVSFVQCPDDLKKIDSLVPSFVVM